MGGGGLEREPKCGAGGSRWTGLEEGVFGVEKQTCNARLGKLKEVKEQAGWGAVS